MANVELETPKGVEFETPRVETPNASRGGEWGRGIPLPSRLWGLGERRKLPQRVPGQSPDENDFTAF